MTLVEGLHFREGPFVSDALQRGIPLYRPALTDARPARHLKKVVQGLLALDLALGQRTRDATARAGDGADGRTGLLAGVAGNGPSRLAGGASEVG